jgi:hypothetical protein
MGPVATSIFPFLLGGRSRFAGAWLRLEGGLIEAFFPADRPDATVHLFARVRLVRAGRWAT